MEDIASSAVIQWADLTWTARVDGAIECQELYSDTRWKEICKHWSLLVTR